MGPARQRQVPPKIDGFLNDWERNSPGFIYVTTRSSGGYGRIQAREGSEHLTLINPLQVRIFVSWDKENLYLAGHKVDREIIPASGQEWPEDGLIFC
ncbi:MAG TPA: hypothetical protein PKX93_11695, partial [bacterium]|nr:hypothetical protein [bacterium]